MNATIQFDVVAARGCTADDIAKHYAEKLDMDASEIRVSIEHEGEPWPADSYDTAAKFASVPDPGYANLLDSGAKELNAWGWTVVDHELFRVCPKCGRMMIEIEYLAGGGCHGCGELAPRKRCDCSCPTCGGERP